MKDVWNSALPFTDGQRYVTMHGTTELPVWRVDSLGSHHMVCSHACISDRNTYNCVLPTGAVAIPGNYRDRRIPFGITEIHCDGSEGSVTACSHNNDAASRSVCYRREEASAICQGKTI